MRKYYLLLGMALAACSSPKYVYHFDHYDYNSGRKLQTKEIPVNSTEAVAEASPLVTEQEDLVASTASAPVTVKEKTTLPSAPVTKAEAKSAFEKKYRSMTKAERKEFRQAVKHEIKNYMKAKKEGDHGASVAATSELDRDLKLAIIFGAVGLTLTLFGGVTEVFWVLGVIAIVIGLVFFIQWLMRQ